MLLISMYYSYYRILTNYIEESVKFDIQGTVYRDKIYENDQQDATV
jgi:hypothetical protein